MSYQLSKVWRGGSPRLQRSRRRGGWRRVGGSDLRGVWFFQLQELRADSQIRILNAETRQMMLVGSVALIGIAIAILVGVLWLIVNFQR